MWKRIATAAVLLTAVLGTLFGLRQISPYFADALGLIVCALGVYEMCGAFKKAGYRPMSAPLIVAIVVVFPLTRFFGGAGVLLALSAAAAIAIVILTFRHGYELRDLFATAFVAIYPLAIFSSFFIVNASPIGLLAITLMLFVPVLSDTFAYFVGITFGGKKLCPEISPKKTVSGAVGGVFGGFVGSMAVYILFDVFALFEGMPNVAVPTLSAVFGKGGAFAAYLSVGLVGGAVCELGDLGASWMKRKAGIKDFGKIFPGHGGMMDRLDSILFMMPIVLLLTQICTAVS